MDSSIQSEVGDSYTSNEVNKSIDLFKTSFSNFPPQNDIMGIRISPAKVKF